MDYREKINAMLENKSQRQLAKEMHIRQDTISRWARGVKTPTTKKNTELIDKQFEIIFGVKAIAAIDEKVIKATRMITELSKRILAKSPKENARVKLTCVIKLKNITLHNLLTNNKISEDEYNLIADYYAYETGRTP